MAADATNIPELSVSELSQAVKRTVEGAFDHVRVRGEISRPAFPGSGHIYFTLKDENAVLDAVCWRGTAQRLSVKPEEGLEVVAIGRLTTYPGRSKYQIVVEALEVAGEGALLKLLEERKKKLAAEGLFDEERKQPIPYLPEVIGVVTSPSGAVIRDILHRLRERFPRRVLVWPVLVQGEGAAEQVARAIEGFNGFEVGGAVPRPDLLIVARGGGSLEDLWAFNEEVVARAAAASSIPIISAVGHETDTTLIDFVSDRRAPTPTAAAEIAVPVRAELLADLVELERRTLGAAGRAIKDRRERVEGLGRGLPHPRRILEDLTQRSDDWAERLDNAVKSFLRHQKGELRQVMAALSSPHQQLRLARQSLAGLEAEQRMARGFTQRLARARDGLDGLARLLKSTNIDEVLKRGFAIVSGPDGVVTGAAQIGPAIPLTLRFQDGEVSAVSGGSGGGSKTKKKPSGAKGGSDDGDQGTLL